MSAFDELKKLEEQRRELVKKVESEALAKAKEAIETLNALGLPYKLVEGETVRQEVTNRPRRSGIRQDVLHALEQRSMSRAEILEHFNAHDKSSQQSISNALAALKKAGAIDNSDGTYSVTNAG